MAPPKRKEGGQPGNKNALGNKSTSKYKPEYAEVARKLCAKAAFIDDQLADWFEVSIRTIHQWKIDHPDFAEALRIGKEETDDLVERGTVAGINGYYVTVDEMDRFGNVKQMRKWIPGNPQAGMKWLAARRPKEYREQKDVHHTMNMDDAFLRFLDQIDEEQKALRGPVKAIEHQERVPTMIDVEAIEIIETVPEEKQ